MNDDTEVRDNALLGILVVVAIDAAFVAAVIWLLPVVRRALGGA